MTKLEETLRNLSQSTAIPEADKVILAGAAGAAYGLVDLLTEVKALNALSLEDKKAVAVEVDNAMHRMTDVRSRLSTGTAKDIVLRDIKNGINEELKKSEPEFSGIFTFGRG